MPQLTSPFLETKWGWDYGESNWKSGMDENLLKFSFLFDNNIDGIVATLPQPAVNGTAYFLTTDNRLYFVSGGNYYSTPIPKWFTVKLRTTGETYQFNGTAFNPSTNVKSVAGRTGDITLSKTDVGLGSVDNTSDTTKPVSTPQQTALDLKASLASTSQVVPSITALKALLKTATYKNAVVTGYNLAGDGGGGTYYLDASDATSVDNGISVIVATDGGRWKLAQAPTFNLTQIGADKTGVADSTTFVQKALTLGNAFIVKDGTYRLTSTVTSDYTGVSFPGTSYPSKRIDFLGQSIANTMFELNPGLAIGLKFVGDSPVSGGQGIHCLDRIGNFTVYGKNHPYPTGQTGLGMWMLNKAYTRLENYYAEYLATGLELDGVISSMFENIYLMNGTIGLLGNSTSFSLPNANTFIKLIAAGNSQAGVIFNQMGAGNTFIGGSIENNGTQGVAGNGGMVVQVSGLNGTACLTMDSTYFEANAGDFDLKIDNISSLPVTVHLKGCLFNRVSNTRYSTNNIAVTSSGGGKIKVVLDACSFLSSGTYVASAARPYVSYGANCEIIGWDTCTYSESTSIPTTFNSSSMALLSGYITGAGSVTNAPSGVSVVRSGPTGIYDVTRSGGWGPTTTSYNVFITPSASSGELRMGFCTKTSNTTFRVTFRNSLSDATYTDTDFMFMVARVQ